MRISSAHVLPHCGSRAWTLLAPLSKLPGLFHVGTFSIPFLAVSTKASIEAGAQTARGRICIRVFTHVGSRASLAAFTIDYATSLHRLSLPQCPALSQEVWSKCQMADIQALGSNRRSEPDPRGSGDRPPSVGSSSAVNDQQPLQVGAFF